MPTGDGLLVRLHADRHHRARRVRRAVRGGARAWQRHHRSHRRAAASRCADLTPRFGAALRGGDRRARHCGGGRRSGSEQSRSPDSIRKRCSMPSALAARSARRAGAADRSRSGLAPKSRSSSTAADALDLDALPPTCGCARNERRRRSACASASAATAASAAHSAASRRRRRRRGCRPSARSDRAARPRCARARRARRGRHRTRFAPPFAATGASSRAPTARAAR